VLYKAQTERARLRSPHPGYDEEPVDALLLILILLLVLLFVGGFWIAKTLLWILAVVVLIVLVARFLTGARRAA
jgi:Flp pilus assembly protein TadB